MEEKTIARPDYLDKLIMSRENGLIKILTGIRRCGKSYLIDPIFRSYLLASGVEEDHIIKLELDREENEKYRNPSELTQYIKARVKDNAMHYILLDEIQLVPEFHAVLNSLLYERNLDVYATGSNSRFLSSDIVTEFRGRGDEIRVRPLSFSEFCSAYRGSQQEAWNEYLTYGGLPLILSQRTDEQKSRYLNSLLNLTYLEDIVERNGVDREDVLGAMMDVLASSVGSLTNPQKIYDTFVSNGYRDLSKNTVMAYLGYLQDAFIVEKAERYDVKGRRYISTPQKYYYADTGLRNARLNFRQFDEGHLMENVLYNELMTRGYNVDVGVVEIREGGARRQLEVDYVCNMGSRRYYIQSALHISDGEKYAQEVRAITNIGDSFRKFIIVKDDIKKWQSDDGVVIMGVREFLLNKRSLEE